MCTQKAHQGASFAGSKTGNLADFHVCGWVCLWGAPTLKIFSECKGPNSPYMCAKYRWLTPYGLRDMISQTMVSLT